MKNDITDAAQLGFLGVTRVEFKTIQVPLSLDQGKEIGQGRCCAVRLRLNQVQYNVTAGTAQACLFVYYGDRNNQRWELERGETSELLICKDQSEIFVKSPFAPSTTVQAFLEIMIYHNDALEEYEKRIQAA